MGLFSHVLHRQAEESPCPRCGVPVPHDAQECSACGWDLHEAYHPVALGSHIEAPPETEPRQQI